MRHDSTVFTRCSPKARIYMMLFVVCILLACLSCLFPSTVAMFTDQVQTQIHIKTASYGVSILVDGQPAILDGNILRLEHGKTYGVSINASGTASKGFCIITVNESVYRTESIPASGSFDFSLDLQGSGMSEFKIQSYWGDCSTDYSSALPVVYGATITLESE